MDNSWQNDSEKLEKLLYYCEKNRFLADENRRRIFSKLEGSLIQKEYGEDDDTR